MIEAEAYFARINLCIHRENKRSRGNRFRVLRFRHHSTTSAQFKIWPAHLKKQGKKTKQYLIVRAGIRSTLVSDPNFLRPRADIYLSLKKRICTREKTTLRQLDQSDNVCMSSLWGSVAREFFRRTKIPFTTKMVSTYPSFQTALHLPCWVAFSSCLLAYSETQLGE